MIITINAGHTLTGPGSGSIGIKNESIENREVTKNVIKYLKLLGHTVIECTVDKAATQKVYLDTVVALANKHKSDYFVSIHFNASKPSGKGYGTEVLTYGGLKLDPAERIAKNISALGFSNRGVKDGSSKSVIRNTKAKSLLVECCFIDNKEDMAKYEADKMAMAIVEGLTVQMIPEPKIETVAPKTDGKLHRVVVGAYSVKENAEKRVEEAKKKGFDAYIVIE